MSAQAPPGYSFLSECEDETAERYLEAAMYRAEGLRRAHALVLEEAQRAWADDRGYADVLKGIARKLMALAQEEEAVADFCRSRLNIVKA